MSRPKNEYSDLEEKYKRTLVAEQSGFALSMAGILLSIFIGLTVKSSLAPEKVLRLIDQAAARIDKRMNAKVGAAWISLSDGIFPEVSVVVKDLVISSEEGCWMRPHLEVDEMKLPMSFFQLIRGRIHIHQILAGDVALTLRAPLSECKERSPASAPQEGTATSASQVPTGGQLAADIRELSKAGGQIDEISIQNFHIHYLPIAFTTVNIRDFNIQVSSENPKIIHSAGILYLAGETLSGDYSSTAKVAVDFVENEETQWKISMSGQWREGHYDFKVGYRPENQNLDLDLNMEHIPLSQVFPLMRKYHLLQSDFNGKQIWLTVRAKAKGDASNIQALPIEVEKLRFEGDIGEIESRNIQILSLEPFRYQPLDVEIKSLKLDELLIFLNRPHPSPILGKLGTIHGKATFSRAGDVSVQGDLSGLEFIFSNRGALQVQTLSLISGSILFQQNRWNIKIDRLRPVEGVFLGNVQITADHNWKKINLRAHIDDLTFGPPIQKLMTGGGELGSLSADLTANFQEGELKEINGSLNTSEMTLDQMNIRSSKFIVQTKGKTLYFDSRLQGIHLHESSPAYLFLSRYMEEKNRKSGITMQSANLKMRSQFLNDLWFESLQLKLLDGYLELKGGWDQNGQLSGQVKVSSSAKVNRYELSGYRDRPELILKK